jgi:hypothetical protein
MIKVKTEFPVALDSPDYLHPWGTLRDNTTSSDFWERIQKIRQGNISYLDLGCAGGGLVVQAHEKYGYDSIGLEGGDFWVNSICSDPWKVDDWKNPTYDQWKKYYNNRLFTCDISHPFSILENNFEIEHQKKFDLITAWEVLEHIKEIDLPVVFANVTNHLLDNGVFLGSISTIEDSPEGYQLHQTIKDYDWWVKILNDYFEVWPWPNDLPPPRIEKKSMLFALRNKGMVFRNNRDKVMWVKYD